MSGNKDDNKNSDITKWASEKDGSFKRQVSKFRDAIEKGGKFAPEKGKLCIGNLLRRERNLVGPFFLGRYHLYVCLAW